MDRKGNTWKESNLDPFVLKSDHLWCNCNTLMRRGRCSMQAKNTVALRWNYKRRKAGNTWKQSQLQWLASGWCDYQQPAGFKRKCSLGVKNKLCAREVKMAADGTFLVFCDPARSFFVLYPSPLLCSQDSDQLSSLCQGCVFQAGGHLSSPHPSLWYLSQVCHAPPWYSCRHVASPPERKPQHLGCRPLMGERRKRKPKSKKNKKKECRKGKRLIRWGEINELSFHVHSLSFWCAHQNNLRPTAASPDG